MQRRSVRGRRALLCACVVAAAAALAVLAPSSAPRPRPPIAYPAALRHLPLRYWMHVAKYAGSIEWKGCVVPPRTNQVVYYTAFWQRLAPPPNVTVKRSEHSDQRERSELTNHSDETSANKRTYRYFQIDQSYPVNLRTRNFKLLNYQPDRGYSNDLSTKDPHNGSNNESYHNNGSNVFAFSAYWDDRGAPSVRVLIYSEQPPPKLYCHLWYYCRGSSTLVQAVEVEGALGGARVLTCALETAPAPRTSSAPDVSAAPAAVSVSAHTCGQLHSILKVQGAPEPSSILRWWEGMLSRGGDEGDDGGGGEVAACAVWGGERWAPRGREGRRLQRWLEALQRLGVSAVYLYLGKAPKDVIRVAESWNSTWLRILPYHPPVGDVTAGRSDDVTDPATAVPLTDCLLRSRSLHRWVLTLDLDHYVVPVRRREWRRLLTSSAAALTFHRYWFPEFLQPEFTSFHASDYIYRAPAPLPQDGIGFSLVRTSCAVAATGYHHLITAIADTSSTDPYTTSSSAGNGSSSADNSFSTAGNISSTPGNGSSSASNGSSSAGNGSSTAGNKSSTASNGSSSAGNSFSSAGNSSSSAGNTSSTAGIKFSDSCNRVVRVAPSKVRLHYYTARCGSFNRSHCRQMRNKAVLDTSAEWLTSSDDDTYTSGTTVYSNSMKQTV